MASSRLRRCWLGATVRGRSLNRRYDPHPLDRQRQGRQPTQGGVEINMSMGGVLFTGWGAHLSVLDIAGQGRVLAGPGGCASGTPKNRWPV